MNTFQEALHILQKDLRRLWPFIAVCYGVHLLNAWMFLRTPQRDIWFQNPDYTLALIPLCVWTLTNLAVHQEPLVGDRHFWLTKPYHRPALLLAKLFFFAVTMALPLVVMQSYILHRTGFSALSHIPALALNLIALTACFLFPLFAIATITRNIGFAALWLASIFATGVACMMASETVSKSFNPSFEDSFSLVILMLSCIAVVLIQYFSRRTAFARWIVVACLFITLVPELLPLPRMSVPLAYPAYSRESPIVVRYDSSSDRRIFDGKPTELADGLVPVYLPIAIDGLNTGHRFALDGIRVQLRAPDGQSFDTGWQRRVNIFLQPGSSATTLDFTVPLAFFAKEGTQSVSLVATLALHHTYAGPTQHVTLQRDKTSIPFLGLCSVHRSTFFPLESLDCVSALYNQPYVEVAAQWYTAPCGTKDSQPGPVGTDEVRGDTKEITFPFALPGVYRKSLGLGGGIPGAQEDRANLHLCPGSQITLNRVVDGGQNTLTTRASVKLAYYAGTIVGQANPAEK
jgi:hypothetical protein